MCMKCLEEADLPREKEMSGGLGLGEGELGGSENERDLFLR